VARVVSRTGRGGWGALERDESESVGREKEPVSEVRLGCGNAGLEDSELMNGLLSRPMALPMDCATLNKLRLLVLKWCSLSVPSTKDSTSCFSARTNLTRVATQTAMLAWVGAEHRGTNAEFERVEADVGQ
jgi:hypothetical protein